jgi:acetyl-CoA synthetase
LNVCYNCVDRYAETQPEEIAIIWEGDETSQNKTYTYKELKSEISKFANVLKKLGVQKGDVVTIYLTMIPEVAFAMLACARIGAIHSVIFGGFAPESIAGRIKDCKSQFVITADEGIRGGKIIPLKKYINTALEDCDDPIKTLVVRYTNTQDDLHQVNNFYYDELIKEVDDQCECVSMNAEDPLFILYTSGSTGKPKGVLHTTGGYLVYASFTHKYSFDYHPGDVYWCTADAGWITGHSYSVYGPLANGGKTLLFEGVPNYPNFSRFWEVCEKYKVNIFYTAPTVLRSLMKEGNSYIDKCDLSSLRVLGTVGEPINPEAWNWYSSIVGKDKCPIVDTWWQTETGGHLISPIPGVSKLKPGSATQPYFGIDAAIVDDSGNVLEGECEGKLCILDSWPGQMRTVYGDHQRFIDTYFSQFKGKYFTGDGCRRDKDGFYWITGRVDDCINVSGHLLGTAEIESAFVEHELVSEAAVVGYPHDIKGQGIYAYVTTNTGVQVSEDLKKELVQWIRKKIGPIATPDKLQFSPGLPKTRSGKIMRRILRKIASNEQDQLGDISTLADPNVVRSLIDGSKNI